jgi:outer membrane protein with beta-barrel domain
MWSSGGDVASDDREKTVQEGTMKRLVAGTIVGFSVAVAGSAFAQEAPAGPGRVEVSIVPVGATFVTSKEPAPDFHSYDVGTALAYNFSRILGVEGEISGGFGMRQDLDQFNGLGRTQTPNMFGYTGNAVLMMPVHSFVPYATAGIGGTTISRREVLDIFDRDTFLTGNVGGGVKWYMPGGRWGLRGDYRFEATKSKDNAPEFFGANNRYGHRVYGAVVINAVK